MKRFWKGILCVALGGILVAALLALFPGSTEEKSEFGGGVSFSMPSGFYDEPFWLELDGNGGTVYYTLDSSEPDDHSTPYTGPILIEDASAHENVYSMNADMSLYYQPEVLENNGKPVLYHYELPQKPVDKATVLRAISVDASGNRSGIEEAVYFVGFGDKKGYDGMNIMTITTDPGNLFDSRQGIYVLGDAFADIVKDGVVAKSERAAFTWEANYNLKGEASEREAAIQCFDAERRLVFAGNYGIRIHGKSTRSKMPKNLNIYARQSYGCASIDTRGLFSRDYTLKKIGLYSGPSSSGQIRDWLANQLAESLDVAIQEIAPCVLFLDGEYWGVYWLTPRFKRDYVSQIFGADPENIVGIKNGAVEDGLEEDFELYNDMVSFIADNDMRLPENYARACEMIDLESCIDYYALEIYIANVDWPENNMALWRTRKPSAGQYSDCKWRWMLFDMDYSMLTSRLKDDTLQRALKRDPMFSSLMENREFADTLYRKLMEFAASEAFGDAAIDANVDTYMAGMADALLLKCQRFYGEDSTIESLYAEGDEIRRFFRERRDFIVGYYGQRLRQAS